jgi:cardiolipin synthase
MKTPWIILILLMPVFGTTLFLLIGLNGMTRKMRKILRRDRPGAAAAPFRRIEEASWELEKKDPPVAICRNILHYGGYPVIPEHGHYLL